jgi:serine/threonine protein kinase
MSAPEMIRPDSSQEEIKLKSQNSEEEPKRQYDYAVDMWTLGCIMVNLVSGVPPFELSSTYSKLRDDQD